MERACHHGKGSKESSSSGTRATRSVHKLHSFERRIKSENQHKNPDLEENLPSYMRQTCSSLCKRNSFRFRDFEGHDVQCCRQKEGRKALTPRADGKRTPRKTSPGTHDGHKTVRRRNRSKSLDVKSFCSASPRSELSMVEEAAEDDAASCTISLISKKSTETIDEASSQTLSDLPRKQSTESELTTKTSLETIEDDASTLLSKKSEDLDSSTVLGKQNEEFDASVLQCKKSEDLDSSTILSKKSEDLDASEKVEAMVESVATTEPDLEGNKMSSLMEECFESVIHEALNSGNASPNRQVHVRETSFATTITLEDAFSEAGVDDSCCLGSDSEDGNKSATPEEKSDLDLFKSASEGLQPPTPFTETPVQFDSGNPEDVFNIMEEAKWLEDDSDDDDNSKLESHRLNDILGSFTDSEFGDEYAQLLIDKHHAKEKGATKVSSNSNGFNVRFPAQDGLFKQETDEKKLFAKSDSSKLEKADGSFQIRGHGLLWMLGGNLLAGVVGAAIASAGLPMGSHGSGQEVEDGICSPHGDGACADDWFFQATSHVSPDE